MGLIANMQADFTAINADFFETITVSRGAISYDAKGMASRIWSSSGTISGTFRPIDGATMRAEAGLKIQSVGRVFAAYNASVEENNKLTRANGEVYYVNYIKAMNSHKVIYLKRNETQK